MSKLHTLLILVAACFSWAYCKSLIEDSDAYNHLPHFGKPNYYKQEHLTLALGSKAPPYSYGIVANGPPVRGFILNNQDENENYPDFNWVVLVPSHYFSGFNSPRLSKREARTERPNEPTNPTRAG